MKRLIIVDNSLQLGHWLQIALAQVDPQVEAKALFSGEEALLEGTRNPIDLLVTDIRLTGMSGFDLIRKMRKQHPQVKVIILTDLAYADIKKQLDEIGIDVFFNKPLKVSFLMDSVASLLKEGESQPPAQGAASVISQSMRTTVLHPVSTVPLPPTTVLHPHPTALEDISPQPALTDADKILVMLLSRLYKDSGALAVLLLAGNGRVISQIGMFPDPTFLNNWVEPLGRAAQVGEAILELMEMPTGRHEMIFHGAMFDVVLAPIGEYPLILALRKGYTPVRMAFVFEEIQAAHKELLGHLESQPEPPAPPDRFPVIQAISEQSAGKIEKPSSPSASQPVHLPSILDRLTPEEDKSSNPPVPPIEKQAQVTLDELLQQPDQLILGEAETFWEDVSAEVRQMGDIPDTITFEQAQKMGLFRDTDKDKK